MRSEGGDSVKAAVRWMGRSGLVEAQDLVKLAFDVHKLGVGGGWHRCSRHATGYALKRNGRLDIGWQVLGDDGIPETEQRLVDLQRLHVVAGLHRIPQRDADAGDGGRVRGDRAVRAERE